MLCALHCSQSCCLYTCVLPLHTRSAGSEVQLLVDDVQVALILPAGTYLGLHLKNISAPPTVLILCMFSMIPFFGAWGIPQFTGGRKLTICNKAECSSKFMTHMNTQSACTILLFLQVILITSCDFLHTRMTSYSK